MDQSNSNSFVSNTLRVEYESVYYERGNSGVDNPAGFRDPSHYDTGKSKLSTGGGQTPTLVDDWTNVFEDLLNGNIDLGTLLSGFRIINQDLPRNNTNFSTPSVQTNLPPTLGGQQNLAFPRSSSFAQDTQTNQVARNNLGNTLTNQTRNDIVSQVRTNRQFAEQLANTGLNVLPPNVFPPALQNTANQMALAGSVNEKMQFLIP